MTLEAVTAAVGAHGLELRYRDYVMHGEVWIDPRSAGVKPGSMRCLSSSTLLTTSSPFATSRLTAGARSPGRRRCTYLRTLKKAWMVEPSLAVKVVL